MAKKVFIDGKAGTTGLRIYERLEQFGGIELISLSDDKRKDRECRKEALNSADIAFLCLPDDAARESVSLIENGNTVVIDTSTAHRTLDDWAYGFPELSPSHREKLKNSKRIAVPGCHASGFISLIYPLVEAGALDGTENLSCFSLTGYSGGGKKMIAQYDEEEGADFKAPRQYGLSQNHKHLPEIMKVCHLCEAPLFSPVVDDFFEGMEVTIGFHTHFLQLPCGLPGDIDTDDFHMIFKKHYENSKLIHLSPLSLEETNGLFLSANENAGKDSLTIHIAGNDDRVLVISTFDNLGKGASGAAIECMNLMLGMPEETGLVI